MIFMKRIICLAAICLLAFGRSYAQESTFKGSFYFEGNDSQNAEFYTNQMNVVVSGGEAVVTINLKAGPRSEPDDYVSFAGTLKGKLTANSILATGKIHMALMDASRLGNHFEEKDVPGEISGTGEGGNLSGSLSVTVDGRKQGFMKFTLRTEEMAPVLLFPLGKSPKVFDKGWLFGAEFKILNKDGEVEKDLSDEIQWSGTADFEPETGASSRPTFNRVGDNKIILTVEYEGKKYKKEYPVITVDANKYARIGSFVVCPADSHGGPADPLPVVGHVVTGNANVLIDGMPVACEGDRGTHMACAGPNTFVITGIEADENVLINGKRVAKLNTLTRHCGGSGKITQVQPADYFENMLQALSDDISFTDKNGNKIPQNSNPKAGTKMVTGPNGTLLMSPDRNTIMMVLPYSHVTITNNTGKDLTLMMDEGGLYVNGEKADNNRNLIIESFNEKLVRKGTRFLFTRTSDASKLIVYEGEVEVEIKKNNERISVPAGKVYLNDSKSPYVIQDTARFEAADVLMKIPKGEFNIKWNEPTAKNKTSDSKSKDILSLLKQYWYVAAGIVALLLAVFLLRKRKK